MTEAVLEPRIDVDEVVKYSKHCGWCTKYANTARSYLRRGHLFTIKKPGQRRPSVQIYVSETTYEIKRKGNVTVKLDKLLEAYPELADDIDTLLAPVIKSQQANRLSGFGIKARSVAHAFNELGMVMDREMANAHRVVLRDVLGINTNRPYEIAYGLDGISHAVRSSPREVRIEVIASQNRELTRYRAGNRIALDYEDNHFSGLIREIALVPFGDIIEMEIILDEEPTFADNNPRE